MPPNSTGALKQGPRMYKNIPVPFFFQEDSAELFHNMETNDDDVFLSSLVKGGTTWMNQILTSILHKFNDEGQIKSDFSPLGGQTHQLYPEALDVTRVDPALQNIKKEVGAEKTRREFFGYTSFQDLLDQPSPRLFSSHLFGREFLPKQLVDPSGKGKLIIVLRNLKDILVSLHYFRGEAKDGWKGNEFGPGSLARFCADDCPNAYGSCFKWIVENERVVADLIPSDRVCIVYFESLKMDIHAQLDRINNFLDRPPLTEAKRNAIAEAVGFKNMKKSGQDNLSTMLLRKGDIGDWKNHMTRQDWDLVDETFHKYLSNSIIAEPMVHFHHWEIPGCPPSSRHEWSMDEDPRTWPSFVRVKLREGLIVPDKLISGPSVLPTNHKFQRPPSEFNNNLVVDPQNTDGVLAADRGTCTPSGGRYFVADAGRYHLFVSGVCPWANGVRAARYLLGLSDVIGMDIADGQSGAGWVFLNGISISPWKERKGPFYLHELYQAANSQVSARITVPVLWDKKTNTIVSNDSWNILKIFCTAFASFHKPCESMSVPMNLYPVDDSIRSSIEEIHSEIYDALLNGLYKTGVSLLHKNIPAHESARLGVYRCLDKFEKELSTRDYLVPGTTSMTIVDLRMFMCLIRYDASYRAAFGLNKPDSVENGMIGGGCILRSKTDESTAYPNLRAFIQRLYPAIQSEIDWPSFRQYYRWTVGHPSNAPLPSLENLRMDVRNEL